MINLNSITEKLDLFGGTHSYISLDKRLRLFFHTRSKTKNR
jgi:hypothetical protein